MNSVKNNIEKVGIIGCGWLGLRLANQLAKNYKIHTTTTSKEKIEELLKLNFNPELIQFSSEELNTERVLNNEILNSDVIIITVPFSKRVDINQIENRFLNLINYLKNYKKQLFLMSSIGVYPDLKIIITEDSLAEELLHTNIITVENLVKKHFPKVNILRLGGLMGDQRIFKKYFKGKDPKVPVNHVHYKDICNIVEQMIVKQSENKMFNIVAPIHPSKEQVYTYQTKQELLTNNVIEKGRIISSDKVIKELNYSFQYPNPIYFNNDNQIVNLK